MERNLVCSECGGDMQVGFIPDMAYGAVLMLSWVEGKPKKSFWTKIQNDFASRKNHYVTAYRCDRCGLLKLYTEADLPAWK
jgi:hypothetical protein